MKLTEETSVSHGIVGWILQATGEVLLKRKQWSDYQSTTVGAELYPGDLLQPARGAIVLVQCADGRTVWPVPEGMISGATNGCPPQSVAISRRSGDIIPPRGGVNPLIPYIISPRHTFVLNPLPTLCWNAVPGANRYTVSLIGNEDVLWEKEVSETEVVYSGEPPLESGVEYLLFVKAHMGASSQEEDLPNLGFSLLDDNEAQLVRDTTEQLLKLDLADEAKALALVHLYVNYELRAEAIAILEVLVKQGSQTSVVYRTLGELYREVGLNLLAQKYYLKAIELASLEDVEGQAIAAEGLGKVYVAIANRQEAIRWLTQARDGYQVLGDMQRFGELAAIVSGLHTLLSLRARTD